MKRDQKQRAPEPNRKHAHPASTTVIQVEGAGKEMQKQLREHEERYRSLVAASSQILWSTTTDGTVEDVPMWRAYTGQSKEEVQGWGWLNALHPDDRERITCAWKDAVATGKIYEAEHRLRRYDGLYHTFVVRSIPVCADDGSIREWIGASTDITERQRLEGELRESEQRFRTTFEQAAVGIAHVAVDGRWLLVNQKLCDMVGYTREELLEQTFHTIILPEDLPMAFAHAQSMIAGDLQTFSHEMRYQRKDESLIWVNLTVTLVRDPAGMPLYFLAVTEDITERKQAEQQRLLNQLKDQFIVNVNHELRTPLTEVYGYLELLSDYQGQLDAGTQAKFLDQAKESCQELILLVNNVLDALAVTEAVNPPQREEVPVAHLVRAVLDHLDPRKEQAGRLSLDIPEQLTAWANLQLLWQVLRNLLSNAFKYCPKPAAVVVSATLSDHPAAQGADSDPQVCIRVKDAGPGIPPAELPLLFQKFIRLRRDLSGSVRGSDWDCMSANNSWKL